MENELLSALQEGITSANLWKEQNTEWFCIDCELMPWSAKAQELIKSQYAAVGSAGSAALNEVANTLRKASTRLGEVAPFLNQTSSRIELIEKFKESYRNYCWPVNSLSDLRLAPFHLLATENHVHTNKDHAWHMNFASRLSETLPGMVIPTSHLVVDVTDKNSTDGAISWWNEKTSSGCEGMVVKPMDFVVFGKRGLVQPGLKVRGKEYLRIIYGPEYTTPENLERLRARGLATKRALALREFALGIEALERFIRREPLRRVHECVFGVLALESEPVDPRL